jgi:hypothetical protein
MFQDDNELPYFDEIGNDYVRELNRQDAYLKRGGRLSAPQMIKYDNRVSMLVERLILILEAVKEDTEALHDYLQSIEQTGRSGRLPHQVYTIFKQKIDQSHDQAVVSERDRDRNRVIQSGLKAEESNLSDLPVDQLLGMYQEKKISKETLFRQFSKRERAGIRLQRMEADLWGKYRSWVALKRRISRSRRNNEQ